MRMKSMTIAAIAAVATSTIAACGSGDEGGASGDTIKIGVLLSQTGPQAAQGEVHSNGVEAVVKQVNADGGVDGRKIEPIYLDDESSPDRAVELARQLAAKDVVAIVGPSFSGTCAPVQPFVEREKIFTYCLSGAPFEWTPHFFAAAPPAVDALGKIPAEWAKSEGYSKIGCLATTDVSGDAYIGTLTAATEALGQTLDVVKYTSGDPSVQTQLTKIQGADPDLIYSCASGANLVTAAKGMIALGIKEPMFAGLGSVGQPVAQLVKDSLPAGGIYALASWVDVPDKIPADHPNRKAIQAYAAQYQKDTDQLADRGSADAADGLSLIVEALRNGAKDGGDIAKYVEGVKRFEGIAGTYSSFSAENHRGLTPEKIIVKFTASGAFEYVTTLP